MADAKHYDLIVIGGGPGGYVGAIRATQMGMKVACIERDKLGGVCLNWGCIPTKALLHNAELYMEAIRHGEHWGFDMKPDAVKVNWEKVIGRSRGVTTQLNSGIAFLLKPCTVEVRTSAGGYYDGSAASGAPTQVLTADRVLVATGAKPRQLPFAPCDGKVIVSSYDAMTLPKRPESMIVIGSGAIGMEFAYFYNAFGTKVTVIEMQDRILPVEDDDISAAALKSFTAQGMSFKLGMSVKSVEKGKSGATVTVFNVKDETKVEKLDAEVVLVAIGVQPRIDGLFAPSLGIRLWDSGPAKGHIWTDYRDKTEPTYQTNVPGIYAIGDVVGPPWLAHISSEEAVACVERMKGHHTLGVDYAAFPGCTYCNPQVASIGMTEREAKQKGLKIKVGKYPLKNHGKAIAVGATDGLVKIITSEPYGEILGAHIFGEDASELIGEMGLAKRLEATAEDIISTVHAHPTMHESIHEAALATEGRLIHG